MSEMSDIVVVVPIREGSSRIRDKNFRPFGAHPTLVHRKIEHLKNAGCFSHIYISSDSQRAKEIAEECDVKYLPRDPIMCTSKPRWDEVVVSVMNDVPGDPHVAWSMVTSPLFTRYADAVRLYFDSLGEHDSLVGVKKVNEYLIDEVGRPLFFGFGCWHPYTTEFKPMYAISDTICIAKKSDQLKWRYWFGRKPKLFDNSPIEAIDVNFEEDLHLALAAEHMIAKKAL